MAYASQAGRARTSSTNPQAHGICDRCGFRYNFVDLRWQFDWRGASLKNLYIKVCDRCEDVPQEQLRAIILPADPVPIIYARPEIYSEDSTDYMTTGAPTIDPATGIPIPSTTIMVTETGAAMISQPVGPTAAPHSNLGLASAAQMPLVEAIKWHRAVPFLSIQANGTTVIAVTCSSAHGLSTNAQIAVDGATNPEANGFFSIIVTTGTAFTYASNKPIASGSLIGTKTLMVTANAGLPWNMPLVPQTGI
jgi:hypothetical protein